MLVVRRGSAPEDQDLVARDLAVFWHPCSQMRDYARLPAAEVVTGARGVAAAARRRARDPRRDLQLVVQGARSRPPAARRRRCARSRTRSSTSSPPTRPARRSSGCASGCWRRRTVCRRRRGEPAAPPGRRAGSLRQGVPGRQRLDRRRDRAEDGAAGAGAARGAAAHALRRARERVPRRDGRHAVRRRSAICTRRRTARSASRCGRLTGLPVPARPDDPRLAGRRRRVAGDRGGARRRRPTTLAAIVYEPVLQAAGGMLFFSPDLLRRLRAWADAHGVYLIADEIAAGMGRLGAMLASHLVDGPGRTSTAALPDFAVLSKGLTGGRAAAVGRADDRRDLRSVRRRLRGRARLPALEHVHGQRARRSPSRCAVLDVFADDDVLGRVAALGARGCARRCETVAAERAVSAQCPCAAGWSPRSTSATRDGQPLDPRRRTGWHVYREAVRRGALLRPLGDTMYLFPAADRRPTARSTRWRRSWATAWMQFSAGPDTSR